MIVTIVVGVVVENSKEHGVRVYIGNGGAQSAKGKKRCCGASAIVVAGERTTR
jgi:hypothetical protein